MGLDLGGNPSDIDERAKLLEEAALLLDLRQVALAPGESAPETPEGAFARALRDDRATVGRPEILPLAPEGLTAIRDRVPVSIEELSRRNAHYWLRFPVSLWTRANRGFDRIEVDVSVKGAREGQTIVIVDAVPSNELVTRWKASAQLTLAVDTGFKFAIGTPPTPAAATTPVVAGAHAELGAGAKLLLGPLEYALRTPVVTRSGLGLDSVTWRLERESFASENDPGLQLVIRIPRPAASLVVSVRMIATRYARLFGDGFLRAIEDLPQVVQDFFRRGTPIFASGDWELSSEL